MCPTLAHSRDPIGEVPPSNPLAPEESSGFDVQDGRSGSAKPPPMRSKRSDSSTAIRTWNLSDTARVASFILSSLYPMGAW